MKKTGVALVLSFALFMGACGKSEGDFTLYKDIPDTVECLSDVVYGKGGNTSLKMDILRPTARTSEPMPVIVFIHGGSWSGGSMEGMLGSLSGYAESGYLCASINYRLSGEAIFPAQIEDCKAAVRFLRANAMEYNLDPGRIGVWGTSAGGHLAALLGASNHVPELEGVGGNADYSSEVQAVCNWFGPLDFRSYITYSDSSVAWLLGGPPQQNMELAAAASPVVYLSKSSAPALIMIGNQDKAYKDFYEQGKAYCELSKDLGIDARLEIINGEGHGFLELSEYKTVKAFFDKQLE